MAERPGVRMVPFRQLAHWLGAQDPAVLRKPQSLGPGEAPADGWETFLGVPRAVPVPGS
ncbi:hypothetical protein GCM10010430_24410 [Kitasatospora cystarginea]|uniref:Uncharacterized protein n=1 Tax=Kitasatospora cystarginea TaxID=58350 RepID=A0ABN3DUP8_9ACTN